MDAPALRLAGVARAFGRRTVLRDATLDLPAGRRAAVVAPNGAGKSTLLRIAALRLRPTAGTVAVAGADAEADPVAARRAVGHVPQDPALYADLTPFEHLRWWDRLHGGRAAPRDLLAALDEAGLAAQAHRPCGPLSRGQRQRVAALLALWPQPALLVLDEPFAGLDAAGRRWLERWLAAAPAAILLALHDVAEARRLADDVLTLADGRLVPLPAVEVARA